MKTHKSVLLAAILIFGLVANVQAQEAAIRKNLAERLPQFLKIDEVSQTPMNGVFEVRIGSELFYTDAEGNYLLQGNLIDTRQHRNLTKARQAKLSAIDFASLPLDDAISIVHGNGERKLALFEDPNCPYCKHFERELQKVDNLTVYVFLLPILGPDSVEKARNHWCAEDKAGTWHAWMMRGRPAPAAECNTAAINRNLSLSRKYRIGGTPTLVFSDGTKVPGAINAQEVENLLASSTPTNTVAE